MTSGDNILSRSLTAATQGAAGAVVGACISAFTEPLVNKILVRRISVQEAVEQFKFEDVVKFIQTALPLNFIKFPLFEALNVAIREAPDIPDQFRGTFIGFIFTTVTLPITNYRFKKSMNEPIRSEDLFLAYVPTVVRDIIYANARQKMGDFLQQKYPQLASSSEGRILQMFITVVFACVVSSPGNEWRGYTLQPPDRRKPFGEFFDPSKSMRSTVVGSLVMGTSLGLATLIGPPMQQFLPRIKSDPKVQFAIFIAFVAWFVNKQNKQASENAKGTQS